MVVVVVADVGNSSQVAIKNQQGTRGRGDGKGEGNMR
jgi:hypothetical protein